MTHLILKRAPIDQPGEEYDVRRAVVGRIMKVAATPVYAPWMWTLAYGQPEDRTPTHGYEPTREAAMQAFAKSWRRGAAVWWSPRPKLARPTIRPAR